MYSLKVVRVSVWLALLWMSSSACERTSLSTWLTLDRDASDPRRECRSWGSSIEDEEGLSMSLVDLGAMFGVS